MRSFFIARPQTRVTNLLATETSDEDEFLVYEMLLKWDEMFRAVVISHSKLHYPWFTRGYNLQALWGVANMDREHPANPHDMIQSTLNSVLSSINTVGNEMGRSHPTIPGQKVIFRPKSSCSRLCSISSAFLSPSFILSYPHI